MSKKQWDLTEDEKAQLRERFNARIGRIKLLEALQRLYGCEVDAEIAWWEVVRLRCKIPKGEADRLVADHRVGKVWVLGEVEKLDNLSSVVMDNPSL